MDFAPHSKIGPYLLEARLGDGATASVYRALDPRLQRRVAIKVLHAELLFSTQARLRFEREAQAAARLKHPHLVQVHGIEEHDGVTVLVMEYIEGTPLHLASLDLRRSVELVRTVAEAVDAAHRQGVIHRDLKPGNILLDPAGAPHVVDFGLAHVSDASTKLTRTGSQLGTPIYMAPEQVAGDPSKIDARTDVYALGVILYELLTGAPPFTGATHAELYAKIQRDDPARPSSVRPGIPRDLETVTLQCLEKPPQRRYGSARALAEDLGRWLAGEPIRAHPPSAAHRLRKWIARRRALVLAAAAALAVAIVAAAVFVPSWRRQSRELERARKREESLRELGELRSQALRVREWVRQPFRSSAEIRAELERALRDVSAHVERNPGEPQGYYVRGQVRFWLGDLERADADLGEAVRLQPRFGPGWVLLARVRVERYSRAMYCRPEERAEKERAARPLLESAVEALRRAADRSPEGWGLARTPDDAATEALVAGMSESLLHGRHAEARAILEQAHAAAPSEDLCVWLGLLSDDGAGKRRWYDEAIRIAPHFAEAYLNRGVLRLLLGDSAGAKSDFTEAIRVDPSRAEGPLLRAVARHKLADYAGCVEDSTEAIRIDPRLSEGYLNRGLGRHSLREYEAAISDFGEALRIEPGLARAYYNRANCRRDRGDRRGALEDYGRALELDREMEPAYTNRALLRESEGEIESALADHTEAIRCGRRPAENYSNRARCRMKAQDLEGAFTDFSEAIRIEAALGSAWLGRGNVRRAQRDQEGAIRDYDEAIRIDARDFLAHNNRANAKLALGRIDDALRDYDEALRLKPDYPEGHFNRGLARAAKGDAAGAIADYGKALEIAPADWPFRARVEAELRKLKR